MARGGYRPGAGRPVGTTKEAPAKKKAVVNSKKIDEKNTENIEKANWKTPLDYMMGVLNDPAVDEARRDRLAIAAAPFMHARVGESGKKEERTQAAKKASGGKFAPVAPPLRLVK